MSNLFFVFPNGLVLLVVCLHIRQVSLLASPSMSGNHLTLGSTDPPLVPDKIRIYSMRFCPYSHRAHLVLLAKNISFDPVFINLKAKPEWYIEKVPTGKAPALLVDGKNVYESLIIADFLDEKFSQQPLHSKDPLKKALDRILIDGFGKVITPFYKVMTGVNASLESFDEVVKELTVFDQALAARGTNFFGGENPGMVDYMIWPWFERIGMFKVLYGEKFDFPTEKLPNLAKWLDGMKADSAVKQYYLTPEIHTAFIKTHQAGTPDFDILTRQ